MRILLVTCVTLLAGAASMESPTAMPAPAASVGSDKSDAPSAANPTQPAQNLSEKLNESGGVIHPKEVDPAIEKPAPNARDPNVLPPPATLGGVPAQPK